VTDISVFSHPDFNQHEKVLTFYDALSDTRGIIAIHNTFRGPALGGCRIWPYDNEAAAFKDVLRLSRGMTYKAALANLNLGGGKAVIIANPKTDKNPQMFKALADAVNDLRGKYITAEDVGTSVEDMKIVKQYTDFVVGLPVRPDQDDGDPSSYTAYGVYQGIKASVKHRLNHDSVSNLTVSVQGLGSVGYKLCNILHQNGAKLIVSDIDDNNVRRAMDEFEARAVQHDDIYGVQADVFAPCALGGIINEDTLPHLKVSIIAGGANNQLFAPLYAERLKEKNILYAPDYVINAGGLIKVTYESKDFTKDAVLAHVEHIYTTMLEVFEEADNAHILPHQAADRIAERRFGR
jgi:leucine dehydrogenase